MIKGAEIMQMNMPGLPLPLAIATVVAIILLTQVYFFFEPRFVRSTSSASFDLLKFSLIRNLVKKSYFPMLLQGVPILLLFVIISTGLFGSDRNSIATVLTWTWWWALLIFLVAGFGQAFCAICPWEGLASIVSTFSFTSRIKKAGFEFKWPKFARNIYIAIFFFILLTLFELGFDITKSGYGTAIFALILTSAAILSAIFFEKRGFCRYACPIGRITGMYSLFSPIELRTIEPELCKSCTTKECIRGSEEATACPTYLNPAKLKENNYCTLCSECIRACPHDNLTIKARTPARDLLQKSNFKTEEAFLAIVLLALTSFHGLTMTPLWEKWLKKVQLYSGFNSHVVFPFLMAFMILAPIALFACTAYCSKLLVRKDKSVFDLLKAFAYPLIPIALFYHLAHNSMHFFAEGLKLFSVISDPFGFGWNLFGTAQIRFGTILNMQSIWTIQLLLIITGHLYGVVVANRVAKKLYTEKSDQFKSEIPLMVSMVLYSSFSVWLIAQPMLMRTGM